MGFGARNDAISGKSKVSRMDGMRMDRSEALLLS